MSDELKARRVEWRRADWHGILVDLETGRTVARWLFDGDGYAAQLIGPEHNESIHPTADSAERWCMEQV